MILTIIIMMTDSYSPALLGFFRQPLLSLTVY